MKNAIQIRERVERLRERIDRLNLFAELAKRIGIKETTFRQRLKPSDKLALPTCDTCEQLIEKVLEDCRTIIRTKHKIHLCKVRLGLYNSKLPDLDLSELKAEPRLYISPSAQGVSKSWSEWRDLFWRHCADTKDRDNIVLILGKPGSGKSTLVHRLQMQAPDTLTCLHLPLGIFNVHNNLLIDEALIHYYTKILNWSGPIEFAKYLDEEKRLRRVVLLADGLDEAIYDHRAAILAKLREFVGPVLLTSRYVQPLIIVTATHRVYHIQSLTVEDMVSYIKTVSAKLRDLSNSGGSEIYSSSITCLDRLSEFLLGHKYIEPSIHSFPEEGKIDDILCQADVISDFEVRNEDNTVLDSLLVRHRSLVHLLSNPIFLNLYLAARIDGAPDLITVPALIDRYQTFLLNRWDYARNPFQFENVKIQELHHTLSLTAVACYLAEIYLGRYLRRDELRAFLSKHLPLLLRSSREIEDDRYLKHFEHQVGRILDEILTSQIVVPIGSDSTLLKNSAEFSISRDLKGGPGSTFGEQRYYRFSAPHDIFLPYYMGTFIGTAEEITRAIHTRGAARDLSAFKHHPIQWATQRRLLTEPILRPLDDALVFYLIRRCESTEIPPVQVGWDLEDLFLSSPIHFPEEYNDALRELTNERLEEILPVNLILLSRVLAASGTAKNNFRSLREALIGKMAKIIGTTNFEYTYQSLCRQLSVHGYKFEKSNDLDREWRGNLSTLELLALWDKASAEIKAGLISRQNTDKIVRRIIYQLRFCHATYTPEILERLENYINEFADSDIRDSRLMLVYSTLQMLRFYRNDRELNEWIDKQKNKRSRMENELKNELNAAWRESSQSVERFVDRFISDESFSLPKCNAAVMIIDGFIDANLNQELLLACVFPKLKHLQDARLLSRPTGGLPFRQEAKLLFLIWRVAGTFYGRQLLLPQDTALSDNLLSFGLTVRPMSEYNPFEALKLLFTGALDAILKKEANRTEESVGGWQMYDHYIHVLWRLFSLDAPFAHFEHH